MLLQFTGEQGRSFSHGDVDYDIIKKVKEAVSIPVIGNGNIVDGKSAKEMFEKTNCDAIMIGRGALGNPWIFDDILEYLSTGNVRNKPQLPEIKETILKHLKMLAEYESENVAVLEMRKHIGWYIKGHPNSSSIRNEINKINDFSELVNKIDEIC